MQTADLAQSFATLLAPLVVLDADDLQDGLEISLANPASERSTALSPPLRCAAERSS